MQKPMLWFKPLLLLLIAFAVCSFGWAVTVTSVSPATGSTAGNQSVLVLGTGFENTAGVTFGGTPATNVTVLSSAVIACTIPAHAAGLVDVVVTISAPGTPDSATKTNGFTYYNPPTITNFTPIVGPTAGGQSVTINGTHFVNGQSVVRFGGSEATNVVVVTANQITCTTPPGALGAVNVSITTPADTVIAGTQYTYIGPPNIDTQPVGSEHCAGETAQFTVTASGQGTVSYQWQDGPSDAGPWTNVAAGTGGTTNTYTTAALIVGDDGTHYRCQVTNEAGTTNTNGTAAVTVNALPSDPTVPLSTNEPTCFGTGSDISVTTDPGTVVDWYTGSCGGTFVGTGNPLTVDPETTTTYYARARNSVTGCLSDGCAQITVTVLDPTVISVQPLTQSACVGDNVTLSVTATGSNLTYQWRKTGVNIGGEVASTLSLLAVDAADGALYDCVVTGDCNVETSNAATLTIIDPPATNLVVNPDTDDVCLGSTASVTVVSSESGVVYRLYDGGVASGASVTGDGNDIVLTSGAIAGNTTLEVRATRAPCAQETLTETVAITAITPPGTGLTVNPANSTICTGDTVAVTVVASENGVTYQLYNAGVASGASVPGDGGDIVLTSAVLTASTTLEVRATLAPCSQVTLTDTVPVTVNELPLTNLVVNPVSATVCSGSTAEVTVVSSETGVSYRLYDGGVASGAAVVGTGGDIVLTSAALAASTTLEVRGTRAPCAEQTLTDTVAVTVIDPPDTGLTVNPATDEICSGETVAVTVVSSENGVTYQLYDGVTATGSAVVGDGGDIVLTTGALTASTTIDVKATLSPCAQVTLVDNVPVTVNALPATPTDAQASSATICAGGNTTLSATVGGGEEVVWYTDSCGGVLVGTGNQLVSPANTTTYYARARTIATSCVSTNCATVTVTVVQPPATNLVVNPNSENVCVGSTTQVTVVSSETGVSYRLHDGGGYSGAAVVGTGGDIVLTSGAIAANVTLEVRATLAPCAEVTLTETVAITAIDPPDTSLTVNPANDSICYGDTVQVTVVNSENGVTYQLYDGGVATGASVVGTGGDINLTTGALAATTTIEVRATLAPCSQVTLTDTVPVTVTAIPNTGLVVNPASYTVCNGDTVEVTVVGSETGVTYQLTDGGNPSGASVVGTGGDITLTSGALTATTTLVVSATIAPCTAVDLVDTVTITVNDPPSTALAVNPDSGVTCAGTTLAVGVINSEDGVVYQLLDDGVATGDSVVGTGGNITLTTGALTATTTITVRATRSPCPAEVLVENIPMTVIPVPTVTNVTPQPGPIAGGDSVTVTGTNFRVGHTTVKFGANSATNVVVSDATTLTCDTPAGLTGSTVAVEVTVSDDGDNITCASVVTANYSYLPAPTITSIDPECGLISGGETVNIYGTNFLNTVEVYGDGDQIPGVDVTVVSSSHIQIVTPSNTAGPVDVRVVNLYNGVADQEVTLTDGFTFAYPTPTLTSTTPTSYSRNRVGNDLTVDIVGTGLVDGVTTGLFNGEDRGLVTNVANGGTTGTITLQVGDDDVIGDWNISIYNPVVGECETGGESNAQIIEVYNVAPVFDPIGEVPAIDELVFFTNTLTATDENVGDVLTFSMLSAPSGLTLFTDTGVLEWTPAENQGPQSHSATFRVTDNATAHGDEGNLTDDITVTVPVNEVNVAPTLDAITLQEPDDEESYYDEGTTITSNLSAHDSDIIAPTPFTYNTLTFEQNPGDPTTYLATFLPASGSAPELLGTFSWFLHRDFISADYSSGQIQPATRPRVRVTDNGYNGIPPTETSAPLSSGYQQTPSYNVRACLPNTVALTGTGVAYHADSDVYVVPADTTITGTVGMNYTVPTGYDLVDVILASSNTAWANITTTSPLNIPAGAPAGTFDIDTATVGTPDPWPFITISTTRKNYSKTASLVVIPELEAKMVYPPESVNPPPNENGIIVAPGTALPIWAFVKTQNIDDGEVTIIDDSNYEIELADVKVHARQGAGYPGNPLVVTVTAQTPEYPFTYEGNDGKLFKFILDVRPATTFRLNNIYRVTATIQLKVSDVIVQEYDVVSYFQVKVVR